LIYTPSSIKSLDSIQLYGKHRFSKDSIASTRDNIRSFLLIDHQQTDLSNLCMKYSTTRCIKKVCLQINSTEVDCLSIDEIVVSAAPITHIGNLISQDASQLLGEGDIISEVANQRKTYRNKPSNIILSCIVFTTVLIVVSSILR
jgi:hypothetical protein